MILDTPSHLFIHWIVQSFTGRFVLPIENNVRAWIWLNYCGLYNHQTHLSSIACAIYMLTYFNRWNVCKTNLTLSVNMAFIYTVDTIAFIFSPIEMLKCWWKEICNKLIKMLVSKRWGAAKSCRIFPIYMIFEESLFRVLKSPSDWNSGQIQFK